MWLACKLFLNSCSGQQVSRGWPSNYGVIDLEAGGRVSCASPVAVQRRKESEAIEGSSWLHLKAKCAAGNNSMCPTDLASSRQRSKRAQIHDLQDNMILALDWGGILAI